MEQIQQLVNIPISKLKRPILIPINVHVQQKQQFYMLT
jgi:hypothetical protein